MPRFAYVNGAYVRHAEAATHIEDRGYQFSDGVYEVVLVIGGKPWDADGHFARLRRSLGELRIDPPMGEAALRIVIGELVRRNRLTDALVYLQITRGVAPRNHSFPPPGTPPCLVLTARRFDLSASDARAAKGVKVITAPDERWARVDIKTVSLLPNILAKQAASEAGAYEAWLVRNGTVTEGSSSNAWIVTPAGELVTHPLTHEILGGITRKTALRAAAELGFTVVERPFTRDEALGAREAFITSATSLVTPVADLDEKHFGPPGPVATGLRAKYKALVGAGV